jgi:hypothetical protein
MHFFATREFAKIVNKLAAISRNCHPRLLADQQSSFSDYKTVAARKKIESIT